jgi:TolB-like protein
MFRRMFGVAPLLALIAAGQAVNAQTLARPTVTVVPFDVTNVRGQPPQDGSALADDLAKLLVDSGQFRVLDRAWLPTPKTSQARPTIVVLQQAAQSANVRYLVLGTARQTMQRVVVPQAIGFRGPLGGMPMPLAVLSGPGQPRQMIPFTQRTQQISAYWMEIQIVDADTGEVFQRLSAQSNAAMHAAVTDLAAGLSRLAPQLVAEIQ